MENIKRYFSVNRYEQAKKISQQVYPLSADCPAKDIAVTESVQAGKNGSRKIKAVFTAQKSAVGRMGVSLIFEMDGHAKEDYVFAPAALYNGNRFYSAQRSYAPMYTKEELEICKDQPIITDVPRLALNGRGAAQLSTGDLATPCIGYFSPFHQKGYLLFWKQKNEAGDFGVTVQEDCGKDKLQFILSAPCVREQTKYQMCTTKAVSDDRGAVLKKGDTLTFELEEYLFDCKDKAAYLNVFFEKRCPSLLPRSTPDGVPWSHAFRLLENKYNKNNWVGDGGFYKSSEADASIYRQWQTGWVGGAMNTLPALLLGNEESVSKSRQTLDFVFDKIQHPSGFLYGIYCDGKLYGDNGTSSENASIVMSRKNADALYFIAKQLLCLSRQNETVSEKWKNGLKQLADAFVGFYKKHNDLAQFIDMEKGIPYAAKTASAAIAPAGLALCSVYFNDETYLAYACRIAQQYYDKYVCEGFTNGGPGEILACPDSESAFGMLESCIALYSVSGDEKWLKYAKDTAALCASWCVSYDYAYEKNTQFYRRKIATTGAVWASVQNKHAAPGICTLSGASLFRLYRATDNIKYLELCRDIAHNITQFVSTPENPMYASYIWTEKHTGLQKAVASAYAEFLLAMTKSGSGMARLAAPMYNKLCNEPGRVGERCNLSDWEGKANVGEFPGGSCWCEVSVMLTYLEMPAAYINPGTGFCFAIDHMKCNVENRSDGKYLTVENPTDYDASYRLFIENESGRTKALDEAFMLSFRSVDVAKKQKITLRL